MHRAALNGGQRCFRGWWRLHRRWTSCSPRGQRLRVYTGIRCHRRAVALTRILCKIFQKQIDSQDICRCPNWERFSFFVASPFSLSGRGSKLWRWLRLRLRLGLSVLMSSAWGCCLFHTARASFSILRTSASSWSSRSFHCSNSSAWWRLCISCCSRFVRNLKRGSDEKKRRTKKCGWKWEEF